MLPKLIKKDYINMQQKSMDRLTSINSPSLTCKQQYKDEPVQCNGTCYSERNQFLDKKTGQPTYTFNSSSCEFRQISPDVTIMPVKTLIGDNRSRLTREISFRCSKNNCNNSEMTDRIEQIINENYVAFYQE